MGTFFVCLLLCCGINGIKADYVAVVVEYNSLNYSSPIQTLEENVENYVYQIRSAAEQAQRANIIVFPEYGLTGIVEDPQNYSFVVPDVGVSQFEEYLLTRLSVAASEYTIYVVVNLLEKVNRTNANGPNETIYYNTNVVFANNGTLVAKYRKINLYKEQKLTPGNETVSFSTDFGTFGLLICSDILHYHPSQSMFVNNSAITDVIIPMAWSSHLPFYTGLEVQAGYALANKINLLASGLNQPSFGMGGSAIYHKSGDVLGRVLVGTPTTQSISANIQSLIDLRSDFGLMGFDIIENRTVDRMENFNVSRDFNPNDYVFKSLNLSAENITEQICDGSFCCSFSILAYINETNASEVYKLVAFNGKAKIDQNLISVKFCTLIACASNEIATCGARPAQTLSTKFRKLLVWGNFENQPDHFYRPATLRGDLIPVSNITYLENRVNSTVGISLNNTKLEENVLVFGVFGRGGGASVSVNFSLVCAAVLIAFHKLF